MWMRWFEWSWQQPILAAFDGKFWSIKAFVGWKLWNPIPVSLKCHHIPHVHLAKSSIIHAMAFRLQINRVSKLQHATDCKPRKSISISQHSPSSNHGNYHILHPESPTLCFLMKMLLSLHEGEREQAQKHYPKLEAAREQFIMLLKFKFPHFNISQQRRKKL